MMGIVECKRMFLVIQSGSNNTPRRDDLHSSPFSDITMLLRKQGRAVTHPWPTIMLKLYFARHTLIFGTVWDLLRGRIFDFWAGGYGLFYIYIYIYPADWFWGEKILERKCLAKKIPEKYVSRRIMLRKNLTPVVCLEKKSIHLPEVLGEKLLPRPNHTYPLKSQMVGPL